MSPTDHKVIVTTDSGRKVTIRTVFLEADEHLLMMREGRGYVAAIPNPLCKHQHKRMDLAALCGLRVCQALAEPTEGPSQTGGAK